MTLTLTFSRITRNMTLPTLNFYGRYTGDKVESRQNGDKSATTYMNIHEPRDDPVTSNAISIQWQTMM